MRPATVLWEVFVRRFEEAFEQYQRRSLTGEKAEELLGRSGRKFRRLCVRYEEEGVEGLRDRRIGRASPRRALDGELARMQELYRERYSDFTVKHFHEQLVRRHNYWLSYTQPATWTASSRGRRWAICRFRHRPSSGKLGAPVQKRMRPRAMRLRRFGAGASMRRRDFIARAVINWMPPRAAAIARPRRIDVCFSRQELECLTFLRSTDPVLQ
jgi:transposase